MTLVKSTCFLVIIFLFMNLPSPAQYKPFQQGYRWGYKDTSGAVVIEPAYEDVGFFCEGLACVKKNGKWGFINNSGKTVIDFKYSQNGSFSNGVATISQNFKWGVINRQGKLLVPFQYSFIYPFSEGVAGAESGKRLVLIDTLGNVLLDSLPYEQVKNSVNGLIQVRNGDLYGCIDRQGTVKIQVQYKMSFYGDAISEGLMPAGQDGKFGYVDTTGKIVIPFQYDGTLPFSDGLGAVKKNGKYGFVNHDGQLVVDCQYEQANAFDHGKAEVINGFSHAYIDQTGKLLGPMEHIPYDYESPEFHEGLKRVALWGKWGFENERQQEVIPLYFHEVGDFENGLAAAKYNSAWGFIDKSGHWAIAPMYSMVTPFIQGKATVVIGGERREISMPSPEALKEGYQVIHGTPIAKPTSQAVNKTPTVQSGPRTCSVCNGQGKVVKPIQNNLKQDSYGHWYKAVGTLYETCPMCKGSRVM